MKKLVFFAMACLLFAGAAYAQQDPQDPGLQDSVMLTTVSIDSGTTSVFMPIYVRTDDSVAMYNIPITWTAPGGGIHGAMGAQYFPPLTSWDERYDSLLLAEGFLRLVGWADIGGGDNPWLITNNVRTHIMSIRFVIESTAPRQLVVIDTVYDDRNGSAMLGLNDGLSEITPGFQFAFLAYGVGTDDEENQLPTTFTLNQNYPNPFNPETNIEFSVPSTQNMRLEVYSLLGQKVKTLVDRQVDAGIHSVRWDGTNDIGVDVPSGVYFYRLASETFTQTNKMVLVR
jgi:hypothetical protein